MAVSPDPILASIQTRSDLSTDCSSGSTCQIVLTESTGTSGSRRSTVIRGFRQSGCLSVTASSLTIFRMPVDFPESRSSLPKCIVDSLPPSTSCRLAESRTSCSRYCSKYVDCSSKVSKAPDNQPFEESAVLRRSNISTQTLRRANSELSDNSPHSCCITLQGPRTRIPNDHRRPGARRRN